MKKLLGFVPALLLCALPLAASAHQHASFLIGGTQYDFVIGSLNEPVAVDDKTGVDFRVMSGGHMMMAEDGDMEAMGGTAAAGLEKDLKVELIAGDKKKTLDLSPVYNTPGSYKAMFIPTVATTISYRFFGTINKTPVDITFTCRAEGEDAAHEGEKEVSAGVKQLMKGGGFGCPQKKEALGFPEDATPLVSVASTANSASTKGTWALGLGVASLVLGVVAFMRRKS